MTNLEKKKGHLNNKQHQSDFQKMIHEKWDIKCQEKSKSNMTLVEKSLYNPPTGNFELNTAMEVTRENTTVNTHRRISCLLKLR